MFRSETGETREKTRFATTGYGLEWRVGPQMFVSVPVPTHTHPPLVGKRDLRLGEIQEGRKEVPVFTF